MTIQRCVRQMGVHTSEDKLGTCSTPGHGIDMFSTPKYPFLTAKTPLRENYATFLKPIFFWDTLYIYMKLPAE